MKNPLYDALGLEGASRNEIRKVASNLNIAVKELDYLNDNCILPDNSTLTLIESNYGITKYEVMLHMGIYNSELKKAISSIAPEIINHIQKETIIANQHSEVFNTDLGTLYQGDCLSLLESTQDEYFDVVFADPPFNLDKLYPSMMNDNLSKLEYIDWTEKWLEQCIRVLKPGGSLFLWNLPKWNTYFSEFLNHRLTFRHWISADIKYSLPIQGKLYPSHYSLLYYTKGAKPKCFKPDRLPMETCRNCFGEIKDYGGYKNKMNPLGINLTDVWYDIPPVRHDKYKGRKGANELSIKLMDRIIEMSSNENDLIFDPFGGAGTTYIVSEIKNRRWVGIEIGPTDDIISRFSEIERERTNLLSYRNNYNSLFPEKIKAQRKKRDLWTDDCFR